MDTSVEHAVVPVDKPVRVGEDIVEPGSLTIVPQGRDSLRLSKRSSPARLMVPGGAPLGDRVKISWNLVARVTDELTETWYFNYSVSLRTAT